MQLLIKGGSFSCMCDRKVGSVHTQAGRQGEGSKGSADPPPPPSFPREVRVSRALYYSLVPRPPTKKGGVVHTLHGCLCACAKNNGIFPVYYIVNARGKYSGERIRRSQTLCKQVRWLVPFALSSVKQTHIVHTPA